MGFDVNTLMQVSNGNLPKVEIPKVVQLPNQDFLKTLQQEQQKVTKQNNMPIKPLTAQPLNFVTQEELDILHPSALNTINVTNTDA